MFTIEMEPDCSVITALDETDAYEDVSVKIDDDGSVFIYQHYPDLSTTEVIFMSYQQLKDIVYALDLPVGMYQVESKG